MVEGALRSTLRRLPCRRQVCARELRQGGLRVPAPRGGRGGGRQSLVARRGPRDQGRLRAALPMLGARWTGLGHHPCGGADLTWPTWPTRPPGPWPCSAAACASVRSCQGEMCVLCAKIF
eukprot:scaffold22015_cov78-Phaeocystis_antarctica.AAC.8